MKISEAKLRKIVRTMVEQMDRTSYRPSWEDEGTGWIPPTGQSETDDSERSINFQMFTDLLDEFTDFLDEDSRMIAPEDIPMEWADQFNQSLTPEQLAKVTEMLRDRDLLDDDDYKLTASWASQL
jgi:hypothetical protein